MRPVLSKANVRVCHKALLLSLCLLLAGPAIAQREIVDRVVALVDDEAILLSDVVREMNLVRLQRNLGQMTVEEQDQLFEKVLNDMIDDQLLVVAAKEKGYEVGDQELREAVDEEIRAIKERLGGEEPYRNELERQGLTEADVRDMHREQRQKQILASRLIQTELRTKVSITDDQIVDYYQAHRDSLPPQLLRTPERLKLAHILVVPRADPGQEQAAREKIQGALERVRSGEDFGKIAQEISEWPTAKNGGYLGKFRYGDFESDAFDEQISKMKSGEISEPFETRFGLMIVRLETRDGDVMTARHIVIKLDPDEDARVQALERAQEIRRRVGAGESFQELARQFSDDPNSRDAGGVLENEWSRDDLLPEFREALGSVEIGGVSEVVQSPTGFHLFQVLARTESRETSFDEIREALRRYLEQNELEERYRTYVTDLRKRFFVEIKV